MGSTHSRGPGAVVFAKVGEEGEGKGKGEGEGEGGVVEEVVGVVEEEVVGVVEEVR